jgi:N-acyl-L-homoserine lactone synthetase
MGLVNKAVTREWPGGLAYLVVTGLMKKYRHIDTVLKVEMRQQLNRITMKKGSDPALLFEQLNGIEEKFMAPGNKIDKADLIAIVLDVATDEYQSVLTAIQNVKGRKLTLLDLEIVMG